MEQNGEQDKTQDFSCLIFDTGIKNIEWGKIILFNKLCSEYLTTSWRKMN